jgi:uncharacterized protein
LSYPRNTFVWYELMSTDAGAAKLFYSQVIGWNSQDMPMPGMVYTVLSAGDVMVGGMMTMPKEACDSGMNSHWAGYVAVDDVDAAAAKLKTLGGKVQYGPADIPNVGRFAVVADPQGAVFNLYRQAQPGIPVMSMAPGHIGWRELHTTDWSRAFEFYNAMFGWQKGDSLDMGPMGTYQLFNIDGTGAGGMFNKSASEPSPFWLYYFNIGDIDAAIERVLAAGGKIVNGPQEVPGSMWIIQATDPQGALFALVGKRK